MNIRNNSFIALLIALPSVVKLPMWVIVIVLLVVFYSSVFLCVLYAAHVVRGKEFLYNFVGMSDLYSTTTQLGKYSEKETYEKLSLIFNAFL